jgi:cyclopropane fatty-acyl-phospholipid synthase-like methyltransferase
MKRSVSSWALSVAVGLAFLVIPAAAQQTATQAPLRSPDVIFVPTPPEVVKAMLETAKVGKGDIVYDLGSGDGRIAIAAVRDFGAARSTGIDIDPQRIREATDNLKQAEEKMPGISKRVRFLNQDLFTTDISDATVITLYLLPSLNVKLMPKLKAELKPGTRIVSHSFDMMGQWEPEKNVDVDGRQVFFWTIPKR